MNGSGLAVAVDWRGARGRHPAHSRAGPLVPHNRAGASARLVEVRDCPRRLSSWRTGHVLSTLAIAIVVWIAGATAARRFGAFVDKASGLALIGFGLWIAVSGWFEQHDHGHGHQHSSIPANHGDAGASAAPEQKGRTALMLILGSSPMVEGIPAFFAAGRYGVRLIASMSVVFAASTIATYVLLCVSSTVGLRRIRFSRFERYGEVLSGSVIAIVGAAFWVWGAW